MEKTLTRISFAASHDDVKAGHCKADFKIGTASGSVLLDLTDEEMSPVIEAAKAKLITKLEEDGSTVVDATS